MMIRAPWSRDRLRVRVYTAPGPAAPDLLAESEWRAAMVTGMASAVMLAAGATDAWPDPYGPDQLVFGPRR